MSLSPAWSTELVAGQAPKATKKLCPEKQTEKPKPNKQTEKNKQHSLYVMSKCKRTNILLVINLGACVSRLSAYSN